MEFFIDDELLLPVDPTPFLAALHYGPQRHSSHQQKAQQQKAQRQPRRPIHIDIHEDDLGFIVLGDIPGVDKSNVKVSFDKDSVELSVQQPTPPPPTITEKPEGEANVEEKKGESEKKPESEEQQVAADTAPKKRRLHRTERIPFASRRIRLPPTAELTKTKASFENGVLTLNIPKNEDKVKPKRITVE